ncbi:MAG: SDR family NAD(P)-dependent oxidoreductase, partial [Candidatus Microthrix sp.]|nr:SDR family NAD(P)-dependent oxidoreductase [Candidatus Microthrix sp.]
METDVVVDPEVRPPEVLFDLSGRVAVVTGASSGLGRRFARVLHAAGAHVVLAARRQDRLVKLAAELNDLPGRARVVVQACDVTDEVATQALVDRTVAEFGSVDVLVNNAGLGEAVRAIDETNDHVRATLEVNLVGLFTLS